VSKKLLTQSVFPLPPIDTFPWFGTVNYIKQSIGEWRGVLYYNGSTWENQMSNPYPVEYQSIQFNNGTLWSTGVVSATYTDTLAAIVPYINYWFYLSPWTVESTSVIIDGAFRNGSAVTIPNFWGCMY
jgi:hypothetical protein